MAQQLTMKFRPLGKDEVLFLLEQISKRKVITSKATNASNNKLKEEAWKSIAKDFNAMAGELRRPEQLRLKWENLKKAARKRSAMIRQNNLKTGEGKLFIPPDETLDLVASLLGATCSGFTVEFGGDGEEIVEITKESVPVVDVPDQQPLPELSRTMEEMDVVLVSDKMMVMKEYGSGGGVSGGGGDGGTGGDGGGGTDIHVLKKNFMFNTPKNSLNKRRKLYNDAQREKELAIAAYFRAKTKKVELESEKLQLEIEHFKCICK